MTAEELARLRAAVDARPARRGRPPVRYPAALVAVVAAMAGAGCPDRIIGTATGRPRTTVARVRERHGIPPGRAGMGRPRRESA